jgi:hypothetical protein
MMSAPTVSPGVWGLSAAVQRDSLFQMRPGGGEVPPIERGHPHRRAGFRQQQRLGAVLGEPQ